MAIQILHCIKTAQLAARKRIREDDRTCGIFCAINTIAISAMAQIPCSPWSAQARLSKNSVLRPPFRAECCLLSPWFRHLTTAQQALKSGDHTASPISPYRP